MTGKFLVFGTYINLALILLGCKSPIYYNGASVVSINFGGFCLSFDIGQYTELILRAFNFHP